MSDLTVRSIMSTELVTLEEEEELGLADTIMSLARIRHLPVVREGRLLGLITHRDILQAQANQLNEAAPTGAHLKASSVMTKQVSTVDPETTVLEAARQIRDQKLGCLPVVEDDQLVGIITAADFVGLVIQALEEAQGTG